MTVTKQPTLTAEEAVGFLRVVGCDSDPVIIRSRNLNFVQGREFEVSELEEAQRLINSTTAKEMPGILSAGIIRISFFGRNGWVDGTLRQMVVERLNDFSGLKVK